MKKVFRYLSVIAIAAMTMVACEELSGDINKPDDPNTENPNDPNNPDDPNDPNNPNNPEDPNDPNDPNNPENPNNPEDPNNPENPNNPNNPEDPNNPENPNDPNNPNNPGDGSDGTVDSDLTPGQHKSKLEDIALEFVNYFNPSDVVDIYKSLSMLAEYLEYVDEEIVEEEVNFGTIVEGSTRAVKNFSPAGFMQFATRVADRIIIDINDPEQNPLAGHCYTYDGDEWQESSIGDNSIKVVWDDATATVVWSDMQKAEIYEYLDDVEYVAYVPKKINFVMTINGVEQLSMNITTTITDIQTIAINAEVKINGGYVIVTDNSADSKGVETHTSIKKNGKLLCSATAVVAINDFTDIDNWYYDYCDDYYGECRTYLDPTYYFVENVKTGTAQMQILTLSILAEGDFRNMYKDVEELDNQYENQDIDKAYCDALCDIINEKVKAVAVYNDTKEKVADIVANTRVYYDYGYTDYDVEPILLFPDESKFAFEEYFTERAFSDLLERIQELAEEVDDLL